jgi:ribonuclease PH
VTSDLPLGAALGPVQIEIDCDVLQADGGTRTASINGGMVALALALRKLRKEGRIQGNPLKHTIVAVSLGLLGDQAYLDLDYLEDVAADVDMNIVMTASGRLVEVQGTAEGEPFARQGLTDLLDLAAEGTQTIVRAIAAVPGLADLA